MLNHDDNIWSLEQCFTVLTVLWLILSDSIVKLFLSPSVNAETDTGKIHVFCGFIHQAGGRTMPEHLACLNSKVFALPIMQAASPCNRKEANIDHLAVKWLWERGTYSAMRSFSSAAVTFGFVSSHSCPICSSNGI